MSGGLVGMFIGNMGQGGNVDAHIIGICKWMTPFNILTLVEDKTNLSDSQRWPGRPAVESASAFYNDFA